MFHVMFSDTPAFIIICLTLAASPLLAVILTLVRVLHLSNAKSPMLVTESGIVTLVRALQPQNAESPMLVTAEPISTFTGYLIQDGSISVPLPVGISPAAINVASVNSSFQQVLYVNPNKQDKLQTPYFSNLGDTTSPLSRKLIKSTSENTFFFLKIPIAPFISAFRILPQEDLNNPRLTLLPK